MTIDEAAELASVLGNSTRLTILQLLLQSAAEGLFVGDIQKTLGVPGPTLSHHLDRLRRSGLVTLRRHGTFLRYIPVPSQVLALADLLVGLGSRTAPTVEESLPAVQEREEVEIEAD